MDSNVRPYSLLPDPGAEIICKQELNVKDKAGEVEPRMYKLNPTQKKFCVKYLEQKNVKIIITVYF
jgi:hypothetical protein